MAMGSNAVEFNNSFRSSPKILSPRLESRASIRFFINIQLLLAMQLDIEGEGPISLSDGSIGRSIDIKTHKKKK